MSDRFGRVSAVAQCTSDLLEVAGHASGPLFEDWRLRTAEGVVVARPIPVLRVNDGDVMLGAAEAGPGLALLPTFLAGEALAAGRLEVVDVGTAAEVDTLQVVYPKTRGVPGKVSAPVESLRASFGDPPYWDAKISGTTPPA